jgi:hypothetical protein
LIVATRVSDGTMSGAAATVGATVVEELGGGGRVVEVEVEVTWASRTAAAGAAR